MLFMASNDSWRPEFIAPQEYPITKNWSPNYRLKSSWEEVIKSAVDEIGVPTVSYPDIINIWLFQEDQFLWHIPINIHEEAKKLGIETY